MEHKDKKRCRECEEEKPLEDFYLIRRKTGKKAGQSWYGSICKECEPGYRKRLRAERKKKDPEGYSRARLKKKLKYLYDLTLDQYDALLEEQGNRCCGCGRKPTKKKRLRVDHCHRTGKVRGLLCDACNTALGLLGEDIETLKALIKYVEHHNEPGLVAV